MLDKLKILYRLSGKENLAHRPQWYTKALCLKSFLQTLTEVKIPCTKILLMDHSSRLEKPLLDQVLRAQESGFVIEKTLVPGNCPSYLQALDLAIVETHELVLFAEDDYLWRRNAVHDLINAFDEVEIADYITPYDHPARYGKTEDSPDFMHWCNEIYCTTYSHFMPHESTCMTYMAKTQVLREDEKWHRLFSDTSRNAPADRKLFRFLQGLGGYNPPSSRLLLGPIPSLATHAHLPYLAPIINWDAIASEIA